MISSEDNNDYQSMVNDCLLQAQEEGYETLSERWERAKKCVDNKIKGEDNNIELEEDEDA